MDELFDVVLKADRNKTYYLKGSEDSILDWLKTVKDVSLYEVRTPDGSYVPAVDFQEREKGFFVPPKEGGDEDPNLEVLRMLDAEMGRHLEVRTLVQKAMLDCWRIKHSNRTHQGKARELGKALEETTRKIMDLFRAEDE